MLTLVPPLLLMLGARGGSGLMAVVGAEALAALPAEASSAAAADAVCRTAAAVAVDTAGVAVAADTTVAGSRAGAPAVANAGLLPLNPNSLPRIAPSSWRPTSR